MGTGFSKLTVDIMLVIVGKILSEGSHFGKGQCLHFMRCQRLFDGNVFKKSPSITPVLQFINLMRSIRDIRPQNCPSFEVGCFAGTVLTSSPRYTKFWSIGIENLFRSWRKRLQMNNISKQIYFRIHGFDRKLGAK